MTKTVIVADDNLKFAEYLHDVAYWKGWSVTVCHSGSELTRKLTDVKTRTLVICDIMMPNDDGIVVAQSVKDPDHKLRFRFITGGDMANALAARMIAQARELDVGPLITKPLPVRKFVSILEEEEESLFSSSG